MADALHNDNPYIGPTAFTEADSKRFFGRIEETQELASLVIARRAVLLYAQSGAGKTSLLQASLIPELKRRKRVETFPIARVTGPAEASDNVSSENMYVENALTDLFPEAPPGSLRGKTFADALGPLLTDDRPGRGRRQTWLMILDQFEEIFTYQPGLAEQRRAFFTQLGACLEQYSQVSLLLAMREDYLADLEAHAAFLPDRIRTRMRLERLGVASAVAAVRGPAALAGRPFSEHVAEELVDNLRRIRTAGRGETKKDELGPYVEPVQLQIVCRQLWEAVTKSETAHLKSEIDSADLAAHANVDDALIHFYRDALHKAGKAGGVTERSLRHWFGEELITPAGTRGLVYRGENETLGVPNAAVDVLRDCYIIRAEYRGGNVWYELAHDRLVEPVRQDNLRWKADNRNPVEEAMKRGPDALLTGIALVDAIRYAADNPHELTREERVFLTRSKEEEKRAKEEEARKERARRWAYGLAGFGLLVAVGVGFLALYAWRSKTQAELALARSAVQDGIRSFDDGRPDQALVYFARALRTAPNYLPATSWISDFLLNRIWWLPSPPLQHQGVVNSAAFSADGRHVVTASEDKTARVWEAETGKPVGAPLQHQGAVQSAAFSADGRRVVTASSDNTARVWEAETGKPVGAPLQHQQSVYSAAFSADGRRVVTASSDNTARVWEAETGKPVGACGFLGKPITDSCLNPITDSRGNRSPIPEAIRSPIPARKRSVTGGGQERPVENALAR